MGSAENSKTDWDSTKPQAKLISPGLLPPRLDLLPRMAVVAPQAEVPSPGQLPPRLDLLPRMAAVAPTPLDLLSRLAAAAVAPTPRPSS